MDADVDRHFRSNNRGDQEIPRVNAATMETTIIGDTKTAPLRVMFNQLGSNCTKFAKRITGTQSQQHFVQSLVSSVRGISYQVIYLAANMFPGVYWASATHDSSAILGCPVISQHRGTTNPNGMASPLQNIRMLLTHASSSSATCHNFGSYCYTLQANRVGSTLDSRQIARVGLRVSNMSKEGIGLNSGAETNLHEGVDSSQAAINLAAASQITKFDLFLTFTCNQSQHPGIRHLFEWKKSMRWTSMEKRWRYLTPQQRREVSNSFEMAYMSIVSRCWLEVRKLLLEFIIKSTSTILGRVVPAFFRDEFQEESGNLSHIHGLVGLFQEDRENDEFQEFVCSLQRSAVCDLITSDEITAYIEKGLLKNLDDFHTFTEQASSYLSHSCESGRCLIRVGDSGDPDEDFRCKKKDPVLDSIDPLEDDFIPFKYDWSKSCLDILKQCDLYEEPSPGFPNGRFLATVLQPRRHMGKVTPSAKENLSPVVPEFFALTRSQQNVQVITGTGAVSRYVAKYIVKMDAGNRCVVYSDCHTGAVSIPLVVSF